MDATRIEKIYEKKGELIRLEYLIKELKSKHSVFSRVLLIAERGFNLSLNDYTSEAVLFFEKLLEKEKKKIEEELDLM